jgi:hypothetical protein
VTRLQRRMRGSRQLGWLARARASVLALAIAGTAGSAIALVPIGPFVGSACAGSGPYHAALVVEHGSGSTIQRCVAFSSATITGDQLLELSGIEVVTATLGGFGQAVCQIDHEPADFSACLPPSPDPYWVLFVSRGGGPWTLSNLGISSQTFADGDAEGFRYDPQTGSAAPPPVPTPCPSPTSRPTATPEPPAGATLRPTATPGPPAGATPRSAAGATPTPTARTSPTLAAGPASSLLSPSLVASNPAPVASGTSPSAEPTDASPVGALTTAGTLLALVALVALLAVAIAAARSRARRTGR